MQKFVKQLNDTYKATLSQKSQQDSSEVPPSSDPLLSESEYKHIKRESGVAVLPDSCIAESFAPGEIVWSAVYQKPARIEHELSVDYQAERAGFMT